MPVRNLFERIVRQANDKMSGNVIVKSKIKQLAPVPCFISL